MSKSKQVSTPTRPCLACEGTGHEYRDVREYGHAYRMRRAVRFLCPVCFGSGRVEAKMPARDAVADAETFAACVPLGHRVWVSEVTDDTNHDSVWYYSAAGNRGCVVCAARAAFRAVPGLRGE